MDCGGCLAVQDKPCVSLSTRFSMASESPFGYLTIERLQRERFKTWRRAKDEGIDRPPRYSRSWLQSMPTFVSPMRFEIGLAVTLPKEANS